MKKLFLSLLAITIASGFANTAQAEIEKYHLDKTHSQILFFVNHIGFSNSLGKFHESEGYFTFDRKTPENSRIDFTVQTASIAMGDNTWNEHMKGKNFFNVEKFPSMAFKSTGIKITGENTADITGDLTILDVTKPVTLKTIHNKSGKHPFSGKYTTGLSATTTIKRSEFGMIYGLPLVGDEVTIRIEVEAHREELN